VEWFKVKALSSSPSITASPCPGKKNLFIEIKFA
jgi:hypothetical protein